MRKFSSYGPVDKDLHYYVPRKALIDRVCTQLVGEKPEQDGHYITVWAPRQMGKTWVMQQVLSRLGNVPTFHAAMMNVAHLGAEKDAREVMASIANELAAQLNVDVHNLEAMFTRKVLDKPLILILDEFDTLTHDAIEALTNIFRSVHISRSANSNQLTGERAYLLHGLALVGTTPLLAIENVKVPYNIQRSFRIPNLTFEVVNDMFECYERESGQIIERAVVERLFHETQGHAGLTCWFGKLLTEIAKKDTPITMKEMSKALTVSLETPNDYISQITSLVSTTPRRNVVLDALGFNRATLSYHNDNLRPLYTHGVLEPGDARLEFCYPFVQKRLFHHFAEELFGNLEPVHAPFESLDDIVTGEHLHLDLWLRRYEQYLRVNRDGLLKNAPRRPSLRVYDAIYHFNLYITLEKFLHRYGGQVWTEFPKEGGRVDFLIRFAGRTHGLKVRNWTSTYEYREALGQTARYGQQLGLSEITLALFVEAVDDANRARYETVYEDEATDVTVKPVFVVTET